MPLEIRTPGKLETVFSDLHGLEVNGVFEVEAAFTVDVNIENLAAAFYMDGSKSMLSAGNYGQRTGLFGLGRQRNPVQESMRVAVPFVAGKDSNKRCYVAYWACGEKGTEIEPLGEISVDEAATAEFPGPNVFGNATYLLPAVQDFVRYIRSVTSQGERIDAALCVVVTDGQFHDADQVIDYTRDAMAPAISEGKFPKTVFTVIGIGADVDPEKMKEFRHRATPESYPGREIWCYELADEITQLPQLVTHLVDANTPAFYGGATIYDGDGNAVKTYEDMVPAVIEFTLPVTSRSFTLEAGGKRYTQPFVVEEAEHDEGE